MSEAKQQCFVIMGFGKKTDYQSGRILDLDKSYRYIIKPAVEEAGLICRRADEIVHAGVIDVPMYEQLLGSDIVIADISTSNPNAFYELGVRHALRPYTTITIAEDKMTFPFDLSHLMIRKYQHMGEGIDHGEVLRMKSELTSAIQTILENPKRDSPVYTFFEDLQPPVRQTINEAVAQSAPRVVGAVGFGLGMAEHSVDISKFFSIDGERHVSIIDPEMLQINVAGYLAINLSRENFSVLNAILTFDQRIWRLLVTMVKHFGIDPKSLNQAIKACTDAVQFRLLVKLCGELGMVECVEPLCRAVLVDLSSFRRQFGELHEAGVTPIQDVLRETLSKMPSDAIVIIEQYEAQAKAAKRWRERQIFKSAAAAIKRHHQEAIPSPSR